MYKHLKSLKSCIQSFNQNNWFSIVVNTYTHIFTIKLNVTIHLKPVLIDKKEITKILVI